MRDGLGRTLSTLALLAATNVGTGCSAPATPGASHPAISDAQAEPASGLLPPITVSVPDSDPLDLHAAVGALLQANAFSEVSTQTAGADYQLSINAAQLMRGSDGGIVGASVAARLLWRGQYLDSYTYRLSAAQAVDLGRNLAPQLVSDLRARDAFAPEVLHAALQSSDYHGDLNLPALIGGWQRQPLRVFRDPLLGCHVRYRSDDPTAGHIDVFVYPIRARDWSAPGALLKAELESAGDDFLALRVRGMLRELRIGPVQTAPTGTLRPPVRQFSGEFADAAFQPFDLHGYALVREDKFVKVLASIARHEADTADIAAFLSVLAEVIDVPPESRFMARVRRAWSGR